MFIAVEYIIKHPTHTLPLPSPLASAKLLVILVILFITKATITSILLWPDPFESIVTKGQPAGNCFHPANDMQTTQKSKLSSKVLYPVVKLALDTTK